MDIANTPKPPYVVAVFTSIRTNVEEGYECSKKLGIPIAIVEEWEKVK